MKNLSEEEKKYLGYKMKEFTDYLKEINKDFENWNKTDKKGEKNNESI